MADLISLFECTIKRKDKFAKKKLRKRIKDEFCNCAIVFENMYGRLIFLLKDLSQEELAINVIELQKLSVYQQDSSSEKSIDIATETIRKEIKSYKSSFTWPPQIQNLELDQTILPTYLNRFL